MAVLGACITCFIIALYVKHIRRKRQDLPRCENPYADVENANQMYDAIEKDLCTASAVASVPKDDEMSPYVDMFGVQIAPDSVYQEEAVELEVTKESFEKDSNCHDVPNRELRYQNISSQDSPNSVVCGEPYAITN